MAKKTATTEAGAQAAGTDLAYVSPEERAAQALSYDATLAALRVLAQESASLTRVDTDDNLAAAKAAKLKLVSTRTTIEKTGKAARDDATKFGKAVIAKERALIEVISGEETRLGTLIDTEVRRKAEAERVAREEEERRAARIREAFAELRSMPERAAHADVERIDVLIANAQAIVDDQSGFPDDLKDAARYEAQVALAALKAARDRAVQAAKDAAELEELRRERAERERRAQENAAEAQRAAGVVAANAAAPADDDDDLPPPVTTPAAVPAAGQPFLGVGRRAPSAPVMVQVPLEQLRALIRAARAAHAVMVANDLGGRIEAEELDEILEEVGFPGGGR